MTLPNQDLSLPYALGPYRLDKALGQGGMGIVYEAYDRRLDRRVAVKRLLRDNDDPKWQARLRREARTTAQLDHPSIVQIFDLIEDDDGDWIVMERLQGTSLATLLESGPLDIDATLNYARQIARGLVAAHALEIVHRDLKTENVMILRDGRAKILDFGIAKLNRLTEDQTRHYDLSKTGVIVGTGRAMSPEQARGLSVGARSDLFALGILLYECLTGVSPFRGRTPVDTLARIVSHQPQPVEELAPGVPEGLAELVARLLRKAPELRPESAREVERALDALIAARPAVAHEPSPSATDVPTLASHEQRTLDTHELDDAGSSAATVSPPGGSPKDLGSPKALGSLGNDSAWTGRFAESAFGVSRLSVRSTPLWILAGGIGLVALIVIMTSLRSPAETEPVASSAATRSAELPPAQRYEAALQSLRRLDDPEAPDRAITVFRRMIERDPESAVAHAGLARATLEKARNAAASADPMFLEQALAIAQESVRLNGYLADGRASLGLVLWGLGRSDEATEHLQRALELEPTHADAHYGLGLLAADRRQLDTAVDHYRRAGELQPAPLYLNAFGALLYDLGRYEEAEQAFVKTLAATPGNLHALRNLGAIYHAQGRLEEAAAKLQDALKIRPDASLFSNLGTVLFSRGLYSQAAKAFEDALAMDGASNRFIFWLNLADTYRQLPERSADAERCYRRALQMLDDLIERRPTDVRLRSRRAVALARSGNLEAAREDVDVVRRAGTGGDLYTLFRLAVSEELGGQREQALTALSEALQSGFSLSDVRLEPDLVELRADPRFHQLLVDLEQET